jgi:hypothetical protein
MSDDYSDPGGIVVNAKDSQGKNQPRRAAAAGLRGVCPATMFVPVSCPKALSAGYDEYRKAEHAFSITHT